VAFGHLNCSAPPSSPDLDSKIGCLEPAHAQCAGDSGGRRTKDNWFSKGLIRVLLRLRLLDNQLSSVLPSSVRPPECPPHCACAAAAAAALH
jgi:hypothetical protein